MPWAFAWRPVGAQVIALRANLKKVPSVGLTSSPNKRVRATNHAFPTTTGRSHETNYAFPAPTGTARATNLAHQKPSSLRTRIRIHQPAATPPL